MPPLLSTTLIAPFHSIVPAMLELSLTLNDNERSCLWSGSAVYAWYRGNECLYVGVSKQVMQRLINHNVIGVVEPILPNDLFHIHFGKSRSFECGLILRDKPKYNKRISHALCARPKYVSKRLLEDIHVLKLLRKKYESRILCPL